MSRNPPFSPMPADAEAMLAHPRLDGLEQQPKHLRRRRLPPLLAQPASEAHWLRIQSGARSDSLLDAAWLNESRQRIPPGIGRGCGFEALEEKPYVEVYRKR